MNGIKMHEKGVRVFNKICGKVVIKWQYFLPYFSNYLEI